MVQRQIVVRRPQRLPVPLRQIAPLLLLPPVLVGAINLVLGISFMPFLFACAISCLGFAVYSGIGGRRQVAARTIAQLERRSAVPPGR